jgi:hypothetical protein
MERATMYEPSYRSVPATIAAIRRAAASCAIEGRDHDCLLLMEQAERLEAKHRLTLVFEGVEHDG